MNNTELALLGLLAEAPTHAYELERLIHQRNMRDWTDLAFSTIYKVLKQMEQAGWVASRQEWTGPRTRTVYEFTTAGYEAWRLAALDAIATPHIGSDPMQLGLSVSPLLDPAEVQSAIGRRRLRLLDTRDVLRARLAADANLPPHVSTMFDLSLTLLQAEIDWLARYLDNSPHPIANDESPPPAKP